MPSGADVQKQYLDAVLSEVRWKRAHAEIRRELSDHLSDQAQANRDGGMPEAEAMRAAVCDMGDAVLIGGQLDAAYRPRPQWGLLAFLTCFTALALLLHAAFPGADDGGWAYAAGWCLGLAAFAALYLFGGVHFARYAWWICGGLTLWRFSYLYIGWSSFAINGTLFPTAQYFMLFAPVILALLLLRMRGRGLGALAVCWLAVWIPATLGNMTSPTVSTAVGYYWVVLPVCAGVLATACLSGWFGKHRVRNLLLVLLPCLLLSAYIVVSSPYRMERLFALLGLKPDTVGCGYIGMTVRGALSDVRACLAEGRWFGPVPAASADFARMRLIEGNPGDYLLTCVMLRFGFAAGLAILLMLGGFCALLVRKCLRLPGAAGRFLALSASAVIVCEIVGYVLSNLGISLLAFMPLPILAAGNTARVFNLALLGLLAGLLRTGDLRETPEAAEARVPPRITFADGRLTVDFRRRRTDA